MVSQDNYSNEIFILGNELLLSFQDVIFIALEKQLMPRWGKDWLEQCLVLDEKVKFKFSKDLQVILKQILLSNNGNFRLALATEFFKTNKLSKSQLDALANIQICRNLWAHPSADYMTLTNLQKLGKDIIKFYEGNVNQITEYCTFIISFKSDDELPIPKILMNSALFKRHLGQIENIYTDIKNNPKLESKIIDLQSEIAKLRDNKLMPNNQSDDFTFILHMLTDAMATNTRLKLMVAGLCSGYFTKYGSKNIKSRKLQKRMKDFEEKHINYLAEEFVTLVKMDEESVELRKSTTGTNNCSCQFCEVTGESGTLGIASSVQMELFELSIAIQEYFIAEGKKIK
jgi:hypothetical protein